MKRKRFTEEQIIGVLKESEPHANREGNIDFGTTMFDETSKMTEAS